MTNKNPKLGVDNIVLKMCFGLMHSMKFFKCPCCSKLHFTTVNGLTFENDFITLQDFTIKKKSVEKCQNNLALLIHNKKGETKIIWKNITKFTTMALKNNKIFNQKKRF